MFKNSRIALAAAALFVGFASIVSAGTLVEDFSAPPETAGWRVHGDAGLFAWDSANRNLRVTWDSSQTNSYFYRPLGTILARDDNFTLEFDLRLLDITTGSKPGPFEIALGLLKLSDATQSGFWRGSGVNATHGPRNIVEFDYFPAGYYPGWGPVDPSLAPTIVSKDNAFASAFTLLQLTNGALFHVSMSFTANDQTLRTALTCNGGAFVPVDNAVLSASFSDFRVDTLAIASYSDTGDDFGSVLAHGIVDNVAVTIPPPPVSNLRGGLEANLWKVKFEGRTNWLYSLERTVDFTNWSTASDTVAGTNGLNALEDKNPAGAGAFYRVRSARP